MVMDYITHPYTAYMRLYRGEPDRLTKVVWYWSHPWAKPFPGPGPASGKWYNRTSAEYCPVGEVPGQPREKTDGDMPSAMYTGQKYCGKLAWYERGAPPDTPTPDRDNQGVPFCCYPEQSKGALLFGGAAPGVDLDEDALPEVDGGAAVGGAGRIAHRYQSHGSGGARGGGSATTTRQRVFRGFGGAVGGGAARLAPSGLTVGAGGARVGGAAAIASGSRLLGSGGARAGGHAATRSSEMLAGHGGALAGGHAMTRPSSALHGGGGARAGGLAQLYPSRQLTATGGARAGGSATMAGIDIMPRGYIDGYNLAPSGATLQIGPGEARDSTNTLDIKQPSTLTKNLAAVWSAGNNGGLRATGTNWLANQWYDVYAIFGQGQPVDYLAVAEGSPVTLPPNYTLSRVLGSVLSDATPTNIVPYFQEGDGFFWLAAPHDVTTYGVSTTAVLFTLSVPHRSGVRAFVTLNTYNPTGDAGIVTGLRMTDIPPASNAPGGYDFQASSIAPYVTWLCIPLDSSARLRVRCTGPLAVDLWTHGWLDRRGKDA